MSKRVSSRVFDLNMAFGDPLEWLILGAVVVVSLGAVVYVLLRILGALSRADRYFDSKAKSSEQPAQVSRRCASPAGFRAAESWSVRQV